MLSCTATGTPHPAFNWYKDGILLVNESQMFVIDEELALSGVVFITSTLSLCSVDKFVSGTFYLSGKKFCWKFLG